MPNSDVLGSSWNTHSHDMLPRSVSLPDEKSSGLRPVLTALVNETLTQHVIRCSSGVPRRVLTVLGVVGTRSGNAANEALQTPLIRCAHGIGMGQARWPNKEIAFLHGDLFHLVLHGVKISVVKKHVLFIRWHSLIAQRSSKFTSFIFSAVMRIFSSLWWPKIEVRFN